MAQLIAQARELILESEQLAVKSREASIMADEALMKLRRVIAEQDELERRAELSTR